MIGGFLGAGKSTAVGRLARHLTAQGLEVGLITNDQGSGLVDSRSLRHQGFPVEEIAGGCFCCRFDSLREAAEKLSAETRPDLFLAEPVGSCTDLVATVSYPLRRLYGDRFEVAPLSVLVDPHRAARILGLAEGSPFSAKVVYVYRKQLEEAQVLVINKCDRLDDIARRELRRALGDQYPGKRVFEVSARTGTGLSPWFDHITGARADEAPTMEVDYALYGEGEALLGWLNATVTVTGPAPFDGNRWLHDLARGLQERLRAAGAEVAHLKMTLSPGGGWTDLALVNLVGLELVPELSEQLQGPFTGGELVINLRAEAAPEVLRGCLEAALAHHGASGPAQLAVEHLESFRPGQPVPTWRIAVGGG
jgi:G3E family GTPase